jgi:hypothetical protein
MGEDKVASFDGLVAGKAGFEQRSVRRSAVFELSKSPASSGALRHWIAFGHNKIGRAIGRWYCPYFRIDLQYLRD